MIFIIPSVSCARECRFCGPRTIEAEGPIEVEASTMAHDLALAIEDEAEANGWKSGACPHCAWEHRHFLRDEHRAEHPTEEEAA